MYNNFLKIISGEKVSSYSVFDLINTSVITYSASRMLINNIKHLNIQDEVKKHYGKVTAKLIPISS